VPVIFFLSTCCTPPPALSCPPILTSRPSLPAVVCVSMPSVLENNSLPSLTFAHLLLFSPGGSPPLVVLLLSFLFAFPSKVNHKVLDAINYRMNRPSTLPTGFIPPLSFPFVFFLSCSYVSTHRISRCRPEVRSRGAQPDPLLLFFSLPLMSLFPRLL